MATYNFASIEKKWQRYWQDNACFQADNQATQRPKYYVLDMFPYPSGAGLHVGHPLGYVASDIVARYQWARGYNVLHPMGFDAFGLPAEQYAVQTGQHPAVTTQRNVTYYKKQLQQLGLAFDWSREVHTASPVYYRWTQWIFLQLFDCWYNQARQKAERIEGLVAHFEQYGTAGLQAASTDLAVQFTAAEWATFDEPKRRKYLLNYRLAYLAETTVNWCPGLGTVLANEEVKDGFSVRGNHPVVRKTMPQWCLRITAYADRLLQGLDDLDWSHAIKETQRHWIGRSQGAFVTFEVAGHEALRVYSTRPDTLFGATFLVIAPEHPLALHLATSPEARAYCAQAVNRTERERLQGQQCVTGVFTGHYAKHPFTQKPLPIWVADYVLGHYGTGAVMGVPAHDERDYRFATKFDLPIQATIAPPTPDTPLPYEAKAGRVMPDNFLTGLTVQEAIPKVIEALVAAGRGAPHTTYRLRDAIFSRQRYWGEPIPICYKDGVPYALPEEQLPLMLPEIDHYQPTETGEPPLARAPRWQSSEGYPLELSTMPGWAGSSWYFLRYMDAQNAQALVGERQQAYWGQTDLYVGGSEHATGHLLYARFWTKFLYDIGVVTFQEPFRKMINQGMIQGVSQIAHRIKGENTFISANLCAQHDTIPLHVDICMVDAQGALDVEAFKRSRSDLATASFVCEGDKFFCTPEVEKMSKSKLNVINPDNIVAQYGADTLRLYLMFLGPIEQAKPWSTHGIEGVHRFLVKFWRLFYADAAWAVTDEVPTEAALRVIHQAIDKVAQDLARYAFNTIVSTLMVAVNQLTVLKCRSRAVLIDLVRLLAPLAPHIAEELWQQLGHEDSVLHAGFPEADPVYLKQITCTYVLAVNGKKRGEMQVDTDLPEDALRVQALQNTTIQKWLAGREPIKIIVIPQRMINLVVPTT